MPQINYIQERRPMVFANMSREELIREAEHTFRTPSPIIQAMLRHLRGEVNVGDKCMKIMYNARHADQCPCCGSTLKTE